MDDYDPLRKRYPFLPECYEKEIGRPLCQIPCPGDKCHENYGEHFIQPFLDAIAEMGIHPEVYWTHKVYEEGKFAELTALVINVATGAPETVVVARIRRMPSRSLALARAWIPRRLSALSRR